MKKKIFIASFLLVVAVIGILLYLNFFKTYTVTFTAKLGPGIKSQELTKGEKVVKPEDPTYEGYTFKGWFLDGREYNFDNPVEEDINLTAEWEKNE